MINFGIKLWSSNSIDAFTNARKLVNKNIFQCLEVYHNAEEKLDFQKLEVVRGLPVNIHNTNNLGWHEFILNQEQLDIWGKTLHMADFFESNYIVVHPGANHTIKSFEKELSKIDDPRIILENMPGLDRSNKLMYATTMEELKELKLKKDFCFDFEKAIKAAHRHNVDYKLYITRCINEIKPLYFHISGGDKDSSVDQHLHLWDSNFDIKWIREQLETVARVKNVTLIFETPKDGDKLNTDIKNIEYFKKI